MTGHGVIDDSAAARTRRTFLAIAAVGGCLLVGVARLAAIAPPTPPGTGRRSSALEARAPIHDRNGQLLAVSLPVASLYADPTQLLDPEADASRIIGVLPDLAFDDVLAKLRSGRRFVWIRRHLTPHQQYEVNRLGIPGLHFEKEVRRLYPRGRTAAHLLGFTDMDGKGLLGVEKRFDRQLGTTTEPLRLSIDIRLQETLEASLASAVRANAASGAAGVILHAATGEVLALATLPDFDPNRPAGGISPDRATGQAYECGPLQRLFTVAAAIDAGAVEGGGHLDVVRPARIGRLTISNPVPERDIEAQADPQAALSLLFVHGLDVGSARLAQRLGPERHRAYLADLGLLAPSRIELPDVAAPVLPSWTGTSSAIAAIGYGLAVPPVQMAAAAAGIVNGGHRVEATVIDGEGRPASDRRRVLSEAASAAMRDLLRQSAGPAGRFAPELAAYDLGALASALTATDAEGGSSRVQGVSLLAAYPAENPGIVVFALVEGVDTAGPAAEHPAWRVAAPLLSDILREAVPMLGIVAPTGTR